MKPLMNSRAQPLGDDGWHSNEQREAVMKLATGNSVTLIIGEDGRASGIHIDGLDVSPAVFSYRLQVSGGQASELALLMLPNIEPREISGYFVSAEDMAAFDEWRRSCHEN